MEEVAIEALGVARAARRLRRGAKRGTVEEDGAEDDEDGHGLRIHAAVHWHVAGRVDGGPPGCTEHLEWLHARDRHEWSRKN